MNLTNKLNKRTLIYIFICILLVVGLYYYFNYLKESFTNGVVTDLDQPDTSHTVNMPLTTSYD